MSKVLSELLDQPRVLVESAIKKLEYLSGWQSVDVRLLAEINQKARKAISELGLDPDDTTGEELYFTLLAKIGDDENKFDLNLNELSKKLNELYKPYKVYALKQSVAKDLLRKRPPRRLMKQLHYRSVDSMLRRTSIGVLFVALSEVESYSWLKFFRKEVAKLHPSDFESRSPEFIQMSAKQSAMLKFNKPNYHPLVGAIIIPAAGASTFCTTVLAAEQLEKMRALCAYIKLRQVEANFGQKLVEVLQKGLENPLEVSHLPISWRNIFKYYGQRSQSEHTESFGPHILHEDLHNVPATKLLTQLSVAFGWWQGLEDTAMRTTKNVVSLNLLDVVENYICQNEYNRCSVVWVHDYIWQTLIGRYFEHPSVEQNFIQKLEPQTIPVGDASPPKTVEDEIKQLIEVGV